MKKLILKLFCLLGIHDWRMDTFVPDLGLYYCIRCHETKYV